jgi:hypothetical protein
MEKRLPAFRKRVFLSRNPRYYHHIAVLNQRHLRKMLGKYLAYYHRSRTHLALEKDAPEPRAIMRQGAIIAVPQVGGLHPSLRTPCRMTEEDYRWSL